jgi:hypothetical protein
MWLFDGIGVKATVVVTILAGLAILETGHLQVGGTAHAVPTGQCTSADANGCAETTSEPLQCDILPNGTETPGQALSMLCANMASHWLNWVAPPACGPWLSATAGCSMQALCGLIGGGPAGALFGFACVAGQWVASPTPAPYTTALQSCVASMTDELCRGQNTTPLTDMPDEPDPCAKPALDAGCGAANPCSVLQQQCDYHCAAGNPPGAPARSYCAGCPATQSSIAGPVCDPITWFTTGKCMMSGSRCLGAHLAGCKTYEKITQCVAFCNYIYNRFQEHCRRRNQQTHKPVR